MAMSFLLTLRAEKGMLLSLDFLCKYLFRGETIIQRYGVRQKSLDFPLKRTRYVDLKGDGNVFGW